MSLIATSKHGDCDRCGDESTLCKKRGKEMVCLTCCRTEDTEKQIAKAKERDKVRGLYGSQVMEGKEDLASRQALIQDIDYVFSRIVRLRAADEFGNCECYTCPTRKHWAMMQCGHYVSRGNMALRFDFRNCRVQCKNCNEVLGGNLSVFSELLDTEVAGLPETLSNEARLIVSIGIDELKGMLIDFRSKLRVLELNKVKK